MRNTMYYAFVLYLGGNPKLRVLLVDVKCG